MKKYRVYDCYGHNVAVFLKKKMHQTIVIGKTLIKDGNTTRMNLQLIN